MNFRNIISLFFISAFFQLSCKKESPFISKEEAEAIYAELNPDIINFTFIHKNDIYFVPNFYNLETIEKLTDSPDEAKTEIKMSYDYQKFAYLNADGKIEIINRQGELIETLSYTSVKSFNWTNTGVLYICRNNSIYFYGGTYSCAYPTIPDDPDILPGAFIQDLSMAENGDIAYIVKWTAGSGGYRFVRKPNDGVGEELVYYNAEFHAGHLVDVEYAPHGSTILLGYQPLWGSEEIHALYIFDGFNLHPSYDFSESEDYISPVMRDDIGKFMSVTGDDYNGWYIELELDEKMVSFESDGDEFMYLDWK